MRLQTTTTPAFLALFLLNLAAAGSAQTTLYVDDDHPNDPSPGVSGLGFPFSNPAENGSIDSPFDDIQKAIAAAADGDRVLVMPSNHFGSYSLSPTFGSIELLGKAIVVESAEGPGITRISGANLVGQPGVLIQGGEGPSTVFRGFTIESCDHGSGGSDTGGGMSVLNSSPTIENCVFVGNRAYVGGGLYLFQSSTLVEGCVFQANNAAHQGGGVFTAGGGSPTFRGCSLISNEANFGGAFLSRTVASSSVVVTGCLFQENSSRVGYGGGLAKFDDGQILIDRCRFLRNSATLEGGGLHLIQGGTVSSSLFDSNVSGNGIGGGISTGGVTGVSLILGCTLHRNSGGGISELNASQVIFTEVRNSIAWGNGDYDVGSLVDVRFSNVLGGYGGQGNLDVDPMFKDSLGVDGIAGTLDDDLSLLALSECIDAGDTRLVATAYPQDLSGANRAMDHPRQDTGIALVGQIVDMGAFEFDSGCVRIRRGATLQIAP